MQAKSFGYTSDILLGLRKAQGLSGFLAVAVLGAAASSLNCSGSVQIPVTGHVHMHAYYHTNSKLHM